VLPFRVFCLSVISAGMLCASVFPIHAGSSAAEPRITRVFYLQGMERREALTLLRSQIEVRQIAEVASANALVVTEVDQKIQRSESLLRERDAVARSVDPHPPLTFQGESDAGMDTRVFRIEGSESRAVITVLRAIYQIPAELTGDDSVTATAPSSRLDAAEALLKELGFLAKVRGVGVGHAPAGEVPAGPG
jgi:hypothetical protein